MSGTFTQNPITFDHPKRSRLTLDNHSINRQSSIFMRHSQSSNTSCSRSTDLSPPLIPFHPSSTPVQPRIHRKPVASNPVYTLYQEKPTKQITSSPPSVNPNLSKMIALEQALIQLPPSVDSQYVQDITDTREPDPSMLYSKMAPAVSIDNSIRSRRHSCSATYNISYITNLKQVLSDDSQSITSSKEDTLSNSSTLSTPNSKRTTNFWYPRTESQTEPLEPLKRGLSKKLRGLLQPHRTQLEERGSKEQYHQDFLSSLERCQTPNSAYDDSPFEVLNQLQEVSEPIQLDESELAQIDSYASTVQQRGPLLTPAILSQKFLTRPYKRDLFKLRALFIWVTQNIRPEYHQKRNDLILLQKQKDMMASQPPMTPHRTSNFRQRFSKMTQYDVDAPPVDEIKLDAMYILEEEAKMLTVAAQSLSKYMGESAEQVLQQRSCKSAFGMAHLFVQMVLAAGFNDAQVVYGYLKGYY
ncbi:hypothetical protein BD560DRAFT_401828 [Blakeslea trispora]|nr:hypothetical protein BD560DRAFT_401828 [Blakeslea trispora]